MLIDYKRFTENIIRTNDPYLILQFILILEEQILVLRQFLEENQLIH